MPTFPTFEMIQNRETNENRVGDQIKDKDESQPLPSKRLRSGSRNAEWCYCPAAYGASPRNEYFARARLCPLLLARIRFLQTLETLEPVCTVRSRHKTLWLLVSCWRCGFEMNPRAPDGLKTLKSNSCRMFYLRVMLTRRILENDLMLLVWRNFDWLWNIWTKWKISIAVEDHVILMSVYVITKLRIFMRI